MRDLHSVVELLPAEAAAVLSEQHPLVQRLVLTSVGQVLRGWERRGVTLDPVMFDAIATPMVVQFAALALAWTQERQLVMEGPR